jgi:ribosomal protein S18 acetylase RimI-like enzyme
MIHADIQSYIRGAASRPRHTERIGPFLATFSRRGDNPYLNYAIPDDGAEPSPDDVAALITAYLQRGRVPRLEYLPSVAPAVETALLVRGFTVEGRLPLMVCTPGAEREMPAPPGIELIGPRSDDEFFAMISAQNEAYGELTPTPDQIAAQRAVVAAGAITVLARDAATAEPAGGGICDVPANGITELAGIGVRPSFRRRGIAGAMTVRLARDAFGVGVTTVFLMAGHNEERRIYERAGFVRIGEILHISLPRT